MATPMTPSKLLSVLRTEGLTVREYRSWRTHERDDETGKVFGPVYGIMNHHTASTDRDATLDLCYDGRAGLPGALCHAVIDKAGIVWMMSAGRSNHAGGGDPRVLESVRAESYGDYPPAPRYGDGDAGAADGNDAFYGFECINRGDGRDPWPDAQLEAMVRANSAICRHYSWGPKSAFAHKEWSNQKPDPRGIDMKTFRRDVAACLALPAGRWTKEEDMALTSSDISKVAKAVVDLLTGPRRADLVEAVFRTDNVIDSPDPEGTNPSWYAQSYLIEGFKDDQDILAKLDQLQLGGVDLDALAEKVATHPLLADRLAEAFVAKYADRLKD